MGETYEEFVKRTGCDPGAVYWQAKEADAWAEEQESKMGKERTHVSYEDGLWDGARFGCGLSIAILVVALVLLGLGYLVSMA